MLRSPTVWSTLIWIGLVFSGVIALCRYDTTPAPVEIAPAQWPATTPLSLRTDSPTLLMAVHPRCPCSRASVGELARLVERCPHPIRAYILFYLPKTTPPYWKQTDLYDRAAALPGVTPLWDQDGAEAARFHMTVSGQTLVFDAAGRLQFSGGITAARGEEGENAGVNAVLALLNGQRTPRKHYPVYGCSLRSFR